MRVKPLNPALNWRMWSEVFKTARPGQIFYNKSQKNYQAHYSKDARRLKTSEVFKITQNNFLVLKKNFDPSVLRKKITEWKKHEKNSLKEKFLLYRLVVVFSQKIQNLLNGLGFRSNNNIAKEFLNQIPITINKAKSSISAKKTVRQIPSAHSEPIKEIEPQPAIDGISHKEISTSPTQTVAPQFLIDEIPLPEIPNSPKSIKEIFESFDIPEMKKIFQTFVNNYNKEELHGNVEELFSNLDIAIDECQKFSSDNFRRLIEENVFNFETHRTSFEDVKEIDDFLLKVLFTNKFYINHAEVMIAQIGNPNFSPQFFIHCLKVFWEVNFPTEDIGNGMYHFTTTMELIIIELIERGLYPRFVDDLGNYVEVKKESSANKAIAAFLYSVFLRARNLDSKKRSEILKPIVDSLETCQLLKELLDQTTDIGTLSRKGFEKDYEKFKEEMSNDYPTLLPYLGN